MEIKLKLNVNQETRNVKVHHFNLQSMIVEADNITEAYIEQQIKRIKWAVPGKLHSFRLKNNT